jgi:hypothetical protein
VGATKENIMIMDINARPLVIGDYLIGFYEENDKDMIWIGKTDGEGMAISEKKFIKFLDELWEKEF